MNETQDGGNWSTNYVRSHESNGLNWNVTYSDIVRVIWQRVVEHPTTLYSLAGSTVMASLGVVLNIVTITVFLQPQMRSTSINILLIGLQISDLFVVSGILAAHSLPTILLVAYVGLGLRYANRFTAAAVVGSYYFVILISIERYIVVCHPMKAKFLCTTHRAVISSIAVAAFTILIALSNWFWNPDENKAIEASEVIGFVVVFVIPLLALLSLNSAIFLRYRRAQKAARLLRSTVANKEDNSLTLISMLIVMVFIICNGFYILRYTYILVEWPSLWFDDKITRTFRPLFLAINSATNFIFYCAFGTKFRAELQKLFRCNTDHNSVSGSGRTNPSTV